MESLVESVVETGDGGDRSRRRARLHAGRTARFSNGTRRGVDRGGPAIEGTTSGARRRGTGDGTGDAGGGGGGRRLRFEAQLFQRTGETFSEWHRTVEEWTWISGLRRRYRKVKRNRAIELDGYYWGEYET